MRQYIIKRLLLVLPTAILATFAIFVLLRVMPGDVALMRLVGSEGEGSATAVELAALRHALGADRPIHEQYATWLWDSIHFDFGKSLRSDRPVVEELAARLPATFELAVLSTIVAAAIAIPLGALMAVHRDTWLDYVLRVVTIAGLSLPHFFLGTMVIVLGTIWFKRIPPIGYAYFFDDPGKNLAQLFWPMIIMGYAAAALTARMTRSMMLEVLPQEFIRTARAKGLPANVVVWRHALKNAILPVFTLLGVTFVGALNGTVIMENIFLIPGIGSGLVEAVRQRDYTTAQGMLLVIMCMVLIANLVIDLVYSRLDPRISYK